MDNKFVLLIRNLVMLICLFVVPLLALLGPSVTGLRAPRLMAASATPSPAATAETPRLRGGSEAMGMPNLPTSMFAQGKGASAAPEVPAAPNAAETKKLPRSAPTNPAVQPARHVGDKRDHAVKTANFTKEPEKAARAAAPVKKMPEAEVTAVAWPPAPAATPQPIAAPVAAQPTRPSQQDYVDTLTTRLRELGAGYYLLECWGQEEKVYRFYCQMGESGARATSFEAVAKDQVSAVERVLDQAETWSAAQASARTAELPRRTLR
jgi:hypothetical protein